MSEVATNLNNDQNYDAQQAAEAIAAGEEKATNVNVDADYEASKKFSVSEIDRSNEGAAAAEAATAPDHEIAQPEAIVTEARPTGNPDDYKDMAKQVSPAPAGAHNITDQLVEKAHEMTQPGQ